jgi:hypothetical protein
MRTAKMLTRTVLISNNFDLLRPAVTSDLAPRILKNNDEPALLFATWGVHRNQKLPLHVRTIFRPITVTQAPSDQIVAALSSGLGLTDEAIPRQPRLLFDQLAMNCGPLLFS